MNSKKVELLLLKMTRCTPPSWQCQINFANSVRLESRREFRILSLLDDITVVVTKNGVYKPWLDNMAHALTSLALQCVTSSELAEGR